MQDAPTNGPGHFDPSLHRRAWDAIPWVVAGAASADDTHTVQTHLPECSECQDEWALHQRVHSGLQTSAPQALPDPQAAWQKLLARLDSVVPEALSRSAANSAPRTGTTPWVRWLAAAVVVQAIGLGASGLALWERGHGSGHLAGVATDISAESRTGLRTELRTELQNEPAANYRTLSQASDTLPAASLRLVPAPGMDFASLRELLVLTRLRVVEVSADGGSLGLAPVDGDTRSAQAALPVTFP